MTALDEIAAERRRQIQIGCCSLELDSDGDWILWPPTDVTIFSAPGEGFLIGRCDEATARRDAEEYLAELGRLDRAAQEATDAGCLTREDAIAWLNGLAAKDRLEPIEIGGLISMALALVDQPTRLAAARAEGYREGVAKERERCIQIVGGRIMAARLGELDADLRSIGKSVLHTIRTPTTEEGA